MSITINHGNDNISGTYGVKIDGVTPQPTLVSGTNIKTVNGNSLLGSGDISISTSVDTSTLVSKTSTTGAATLPAGTTAQRPASPTVGMIRYNSTLKVNEVYTESQITAGTYAWRAIPTGDTIIQASTNGEQTFPNPGSYQWVCPAGVTAVNVVCVGGGGGGALAYGAGGGGGLAWSNNIPVTPGQSYTVYVGAGGAGSLTSTAPGDPGEYSYFHTALTAYGGAAGMYQANTSAQGGGYTIDTVYGTNGGGVGGVGMASSSVSYNAGGGGAGGYTGNGGAGGTYTGSYLAGTTGTGGAGGGGGCGNNVYGGGGGGVGIYGQGTNGTGGSGSSTGGTRGGGGSGGVGGSATQAGGQFGGGGAADAGNGGSGAVRIIWGPNRAFPSTNTGAL